MNSLQEAQVLGLRREHQGDLPPRQHVFREGHRRLLRRLLQRPHLGGAQRRHRHPHAPHTRARRRQVLHDHLRQGRLPELKVGMSVRGGCKERQLVGGAIIYANCETINPRLATPINFDARLRMSTGPQPPFTKDNRDGDVARFLNVAGSCL